MNMKRLRDRADLVLMLVGFALVGYSLLRSSRPRLRHYRSSVCGHVLRDEWTTNYYGPSCDDPDFASVTNTIAVLLRRSRGYSQTY
jgi:hypothetical protein